MTFQSAGWIAVLLSLTCACNSYDKKPPVIPPPTVTVFEVEAKTIPAVFDFIGFAESSHPVEIRAKVEGYLEKIAYIEGSLVQEGDLLFQIDPNQFQAKVEVAKGEVARQKALLANAVLTVNRLTPLYEQKAASKKDLDNAVANQLAVAAALQSAEAQLLDNEINLGYTTIRSPVKGLADKSRYHEGALINPGENSLMTTVSVLDPIWIYFTISDNDILRARQQENDKSLTLPQKSEYVVDAIMSDYSVYPHKGKVDFSSPTYDRATGTLLARAVFPNPKGDLLPGQFVRVKVYGADYPKALFVPQRALLQKKTGMYVYLVGKDDKIIAQDVSTGSWFEDYQIVTNGLKIGDRIVVDGINKIRPGSIVQVVGPWKNNLQNSTPPTPLQVD